MWFHQTGIFNERIHASGGKKQRLYKACTLLGVRGGWMNPSNKTSSLNCLNKIADSYHWTSFRNGRFYL